MSRTPSETPRCLAVDGLNLPATPKPNIAPGFVRSLRAATLALGAGRDKVGNPASDRSLSRFLEIRWPKQLEEGGGERGGRGSRAVLWCVCYSEVAV